EAVAGILVIFFFQAEDGIRDRNVTGVQTCALPIFATTDNTASAYQNTSQRVVRRACSWRSKKSKLAERDFRHPALARRLGRLQRSEERRVGKECRCRWWRDHCRE